MPTLPHPQLRLWIIVLPTPTRGVYNFLVPWHQPGKESPGASRTWYINRPGVVTRTRMYNSSRSLPSWTIASDTTSLPAESNTRFLLDRDFLIKKHPAEARCFEIKRLFFVVLVVVFILFFREVFDAFLIKFISLFLILIGEIIVPTHGYFRLKAFLILRSRAGIVWQVVEIVLVHMTDLLVIRRAQDNKSPERNPRPEQWRKCLRFGREFLTMPECSISEKTVNTVAALFFSLT